MSDEYPWDDPAAKAEAAQYCRWVYGDLFPSLARALNSAHAEERQERYWRIIAGPWFFHHIEAQYEKYVDPKCEFKTLGPIWMSMRRDGLWWHLRNAYARCLNFIGRRRPIILCDLHMNHWQMWRIAWKTRFRAWPMVRRGIVPDKLPSKPEPRVRLREFAFPFRNDEFMNIVINGLAEAVPSIFVEHYAAMREKVRAFMGGRQKVIVSGVGWKSNEEMKFIAAGAAELGCKLIAVQHGGNTGWTAVHPMEDFVRDTADGFVTWGVRPEGMRAVPLPDPKLNRLIAKRKPPRGNGYLFFAGTAFARYASAGIRSQPMSRQTLRYMDWQNEFFGEVGDLRNEFMVRTYPAEYGWQNKLRLLEEFPQLRLDYFERGVLHHLWRCRLAVIDNPQTTFLEALAMNKPCVLYFDPALWNLREDAWDWFRTLASAGIVHFSPTGAARKVKEVTADPWAWWTGSEVVLARRLFSRRMILENADWAVEWAAHLETHAIGGS